MKNLTDHDKKIVNNILAYNRVSKFRLQINRINKQLHSLTINDTNLTYKVAKLQAQYNKYRFQLLNSINLIDILKN